MYWFIWNEKKPIDKQNVSGWGAINSFIAIYLEEPTYAQDIFFKYIQINL